MPEVERYKKRVRTQIRVMFVFVIAALVIGLYTVQERAKDYAAREAILQGHNDHVQDQYNISLQRYNSNKASCGIRSLVDLPTQKKLLKTYENAARDKSLNAKAHKRNAQRITSQKKVIENGKKVIALFASIPANFNCKNLAPHPPVRPK